MARLRYNGLSTTLGGSLTSSATSVTFAAALTHSNGVAVPTIVSPDFIPLAIVDSSGHLSEIVYLTAYTAGATTGTIGRGKENTTGVAHASGDVVVQAALIGDTAADLQTFTAAGTWTKPAVGSFAVITAVGAGAGGGSGRLAAAISNATGGGGGSPGAWSQVIVPLASLGATEAVTVGAGGAGGAAVTANSTDGNPGAAGGLSSFGTVNLQGRFCLAFGGTGGAGGTNAAAGGVSAGTGHQTGGVGGARVLGAGGASGTTTMANQNAPNGGGAGGGFTTANNPAQGGAGGSRQANILNAGAGGASGNNNGQAGGSWPVGTPLGGEGGGGGGTAGTATTAGSGAAGGRYGAGGGGGGAALNGGQSGAGGAGADGIVVVEVW